MHSFSFFDISEAHKNNFQKKERAVKKFNKILPKVRHLSNILC